MSRLNELNNRLNKNFNTEEEVLDYLSELFNDTYEMLGDAQDAFNFVNDTYFKILNDFDMCYMLYEDEWNITNVEGAFVSDKDLASINNEVMKIMSNSGCDVNNALKLFLEENDEFDELIEVKGNLSPRIVFIEDIFS